MKILIYGAGVIGTLCAAKLQESGHRVTAIARGERLTNIRRYRLMLEDIASGCRSATQVDTSERLDPNDACDIALITVRRDQVASVMSELAANRCIPTLLCMLSNPIGSANLVATLGEDRVLLGFPGPGGTRDGPLVRYALIAQQPTTLGELTGGALRAFAMRSVHLVGRGFRPTYLAIWAHGRRRTRSSSPPSAAPSTWLAAIVIDCLKTIAP